MAIYSGSGNADPVNAPPIVLVLGIIVFLFNTLDIMIDIWIRHIQWYLSEKLDG